MKDIPYHNVPARSNLSDNNRIFLGDAGQEGSLLPAFSCLPRDECSPDSWQMTECGKVNFLTRKCISGS